MNESLLYSLGTPSSIFDTDNSDWVASQNLGNDFQNVKAASRRDTIELRKGKTLPMDFRKRCPNCVVIIDCFEIFLERPLSTLVRAQTFSSYKHHNTVK